MKPRATIYGRAGCVDCERLAQILTKMGYDVLEIDITKDVDAMALFAERDGGDPPYTELRGVPTEEVICQPRATEAK